MYDEYFCRCFSSIIVNASVLRKHKRTQIATQVNGNYNRVLVFFSFFKMKNKSFKADVHNSNVMRIILFLRTKTGVITVFDEFSLCRVKLFSILCG